MSITEVAVRIFGYWGQPKDIITTLDTFSPHYKITCLEKMIEACEGEIRKLQKGTSK